MSRDDATLLDILKAAQLVVEFKGDIDHTDFLQDLKTQSSILHQLLIIGEAVKRLSKKFKTSHPEIPWKKVAGMRNKIIHEYNDVDMDEVWKTIELEIPPLIKYLSL